MIKKMMATVANSKDVMASQHSKSDLNRQGTTTKGLFRSLLSSMKGKLENEVEQGAATKQNAENSSAREGEGEEKGNVKPQSLIQRRNGTTGQGKSNSVTPPDHTDSGKETGQKSADQKAELADEKGNTGDTSPDNKVEMKAGQLNGENPVPQNKKGESETKESGTAESEKKKLNIDEVDSAPVVSTTKRAEADKNSNNANAENVSKDKGETQTGSPQKANVAKEQADLPLKQKDKDQGDAGQASKTKSANGTAVPGSGEQKIGKQVQSGEKANFPNDTDGNNQKNIQTLSDHSISKGSGSQKQSVLTTASNGDQSVGKGEGIVQKSPKIERNNGSQKQEENRPIFRRIERNGEENGKQSTNRLRSPKRDQRASRINERRALTFKKVTEGGSNSYSITRGESDKELSARQEKLFNNLAIKGNTGNSLEKGVTIQTVQADQAKKEESKKRLSSFIAREQRADGNRMRGDRNRQVWNQRGKLSIPPSTSAGISNVAGDFSTGSEIQFDEEKIVWQEHASETAESKEVKGTEQHSSAHVKLGQVPVSNISLRRKVVPGLTKTVRTAAGEAKKTPETWQKHNFTLDDGKKIHLSARQVKGVLQLKLGSLHGDLNRLLQQHQQQIREHLEQECGTEIDLQLENSGEQQMSDFFGNSDSSSSQRGRKGNGTLPGAQTSSQQTDRELTESVRNFGYNKMEWTA